MEYGPRGKVGEDIREYDVARLLKACVYVSFWDKIRSLIAYVGCWNVHQEAGDD
jgi:hypothetical protein